LATTYYIYPTSDKTNWNTTEFAVWSSKNLVTWKKEGVILDVTKDLKWADLQAWAPTALNATALTIFTFALEENRCRHKQFRRPVHSRMPWTAPSFRKATKSAPTRSTRIR